MYGSETVVDSSSFRVSISINLSYIYVVKIRVFDSDVPTVYGSKTVKESSWFFVCQFRFVFTFVLS